AVLHEESVADDLRHDAWDVGDTLPVERRNVAATLNREDSDAIVGARRDDTSAVMRIARLRAGEVGGIAVAILCARISVVRPVGCGRHEAGSLPTRALRRANAILPGVCRIEQLDPGKVVCGKVRDACTVSRVTRDGARVAPGGVVDEQIVL